MTLSIWFGQFNTVDGAVHEEGPYVGIFEGGADAPDAIGVYMVVEPHGGATAELCAATIEAIARGFTEPSQAVTASLLHALNAGHAFVRRHRPEDAGPDFGVGVTVVATRRQEAYVAQAGPSLACARTGGTVRLIEPSPEAAAQPLGAGTRIAPSFARLQLHVGDTVLLLFSDAAQIVDRRLPLIVAQGPEHALPDLYLRSRGMPNFAALYLAVTGVVEAGGGQPAAGAAAPARRSPHAAPVGPEPTREGHRGEASRRSLSAERSARAGAETLAVEDEEAVGFERRNGHGPSLTSSVRSLLSSRPPLGSMESRTLPLTRRHLMVVGGAALAGLVLLLTLPMVAREGKNEKFTQLVRGADQAITAAEREPDIARRRTLLTRAQSAVDEARALRNVPGELGGLEQRLQDQLAAIDGVRELPDLVQVADLTAPGLSAQAASQIALGPAIYLLDAAAGKVVALPREGEPKPVTVFEEGRPVGPNRTGRARHIAWWTAEGTRPAALLVLDDQRRLYAVDARGDIRSMALGNTGDWKSDTAIAVGATSLYVLDASASQVWRYTLSADGFPGAPEPLLNPRASLKDAAALSIAAGSPVVATTDGRLLRIADGLVKPIQPVAIDRPLLAPGPPLLNSADGLLYIADRGNQRVVLLGTDATFRGQLVHHRLAGLQSLALDEAAGVLYAIAGQWLVRATIPK